MIYVPKNVSERFSKTVGKFQQVLKTAKDRDVNESDTVLIVGDILSEVFGFNKYLEITSEFAIRNTYCDLAIKMSEKVQYLVEVKAIGLELKEHHLRQAIAYSSTQGVQWAVLTNGVTWEIYKILFEQPINYELVFSFNFTDLNLRKKEDQEKLFLLSKEGISKEAREDFYDRVQNFNRFVIGAIIQGDMVVNTIRRELKKFAPGLRVDNEEIEDVIKNEVIKRDVLEGDTAKKSQNKVKKFYSKQFHKTESNKPQGKDNKTTSKTEARNVESEENDCGEGELKNPAPGDPLPC